MRSTQQRPRTGISIPAGLGHEHSLSSFISHTASGRRGYILATDDVLNALFGS